MTLTHTLAGISWDPEIRGILIVAVGAAVLMGSVYLLLATNLGNRLGFMVALAGFFTLKCGQYNCSVGISPRHNRRNGSASKPAQQLLIFSQTRGRWKIRSSKQCRAPTFHLPLKPWCHQLPNPFFFGQPSHRNNFIVVDNSNGSSCRAMERIKIPLRKVP